ncbi:MAG: hypothetical protein HUU35_00065 [Armatimonadetes bacterium]|nr:hypothetical protein [Armatimonadota bacterium]
MAFHLYHPEPCPSCGLDYIRFATSELCPRCGSDTAPLCDLVEEVVGYARLTLLRAGDLRLEAYQPVTPADRYFILACDLLEAFRFYPTLDPALVAAEAIAHHRRHLGSDEALLAHWQRFFEAVLLAWQEARNKPI